MIFHKERLEENIQILNNHNKSHTPVLRLTNGQKHEMKVIDEIVEDVSLVLNKMKNKILIELPCKVGDTVYIVRPCKKEIVKLVVIQIDINLNSVWVRADDGIFHCVRPYEDYCYSIEEAEAKLKECKSGK